MPDIETAVSALEEAVHHFGPNYKFQKTGSPNVICTTLPPHWRSNKSLPTPFVVLLMSPVADGTKVTVAAGNEENDTADVKNHEAEVQKQVARFNDLRFVGKSGRGKNFNLTITIHHADYREVAIVPSVIKVTVDGPRDSRNANKCHYSNSPFDYRKRTASMAHFDLPLNLGHPSTSGIFDLASKQPRLSHPLNLHNPMMPHGLDFKTPPMPIPTPRLLITPNLMMAAAMAQPSLHQPNMYATYLTLYAALASTLNQPPSSDTSSDEVSNEKALNLDSKEEPEEAPKTEEKKVWRPFLSS